MKFTRNRANKPKKNDYIDLNAWFLALFRIQ